MSRTATRGRGRSKGYPVATWIAAGLIFYLVASSSTAKASTPPRLPDPLKPTPTPTPAKPTGKFDGSTVLNGRDARTNPSPPGYDRELAARAVQGIANMLRAKGRDRYDRPALAAWQVAAGINGDGLYGGGTKAALEFFGIIEPPAAFFKPTSGLYTPPEHR